MLDPKGKDMTDTHEADETVTDPNVVVFPHAGRFTIPFADFVEHWLNWPNPAHPDQTLGLDDTLVVLAQQTTFQGLVERHYDGGFDALCRSIVPPTSRNTLQASNVFFERNRDFFEATRAANPRSGRTVNATRLRPWATDTLAGDQDDAANLVASRSPVSSEMSTEERLSAFETRSSGEQSWVGADVRDYVRGIISPDRYPELHAMIDRQLPEGKSSRQDVARLVSDPAVDTIFVALAIMAWGRMRPSHAATFFDQRENWLGLVDDLRHEPTRRADAYRRFATLRKEKRLDGVGPAYFTKLIFFLTAMHGGGERPGYIMDQWTARSANFLANENFITLGSRGPGGERQVADSNSPEVYERYCAFVEELAERLGVSPEEIELRMFAGGSRQNEWRKLVRRMT